MEPENVNLECDVKNRDMTVPNSTFVPNTEYALFEGFAGNCTGTPNQILAFASDQCIPMQPPPYTLFWIRALKTSLNETEIQWFYDAQCDNKVSLVDSTSVQLVPATGYWWQDKCDPTVSGGGLWLASRGWHMTDSEGRSDILEQHVQTQQKLE
jgi:hypothetical protein